MKRTLLAAATLVASIGACSFADASSILSINLSRSGAPSEAGFTNWETGDNSLPSDLTIGGLTLSAPSAGINAGTTLRSIDRGGNDGYGGTLADLTQTWWGQRATSTGPGGFITIDLSGLAAGDYTFTSWHLDHEDQTGQMKVELSDDGGSFIDVSSFDLVNVAGGGAGQPAENATGPAVSTFNFTSTGADLQFRFTNTSVDGAGSSGAFAVVNGFSIEVIPEPSSLAAGAAGMGLLLARRRRRG